MVAACTLSGCGTGNPLGRQPVSGNVALDGVTLDRGTIQFSPRQPNGGVGSGALIENGKYAIPANKGLPPGEYLVRLFSAQKRENSISPGPPGSEPLGFNGGAIGKERIPARYNVRSEQVVKVTVGEPNEFDFDVQTK